MPDDAPGDPIVAGVDGSAVSALALEWAVACARRRGLPVRAVLALPQLAYASDHHAVAAAMSDVHEAARRLVDEMISELGDSGVEVAPVVVDGPSSQLLLEESRHATALVVGSRGRGGFGELILGSTPLQIAMHASSPVVVVRAPGAEPVTPGGSVGHVVVGVDDLERTHAAVGFAFAEAASRGVGLTALRAWVAPDLLAHLPPAEWAEAVAAEEGEVIPTSIEGWHERYPDVVVTPKLVRGDPAAVLVAESAGAALLVVGSRGRGVRRTAARVGQPCGLASRPLPGGGRPGLTQRPR